MSEQRSQGAIIFTERERRQRTPSTATLNSELEFWTQISTYAGFRPIIPHKSDFGHRRFFFISRQKIVLAYTSCS